MNKISFMLVKQIEYGSEAYEQMKALRIKDLLLPIGVPAHYIQPEKEKDDLLVAAFEEEELVGCCILTAKDKDTVQLRQMVVASNKQGGGIGSRIVTFAEALAKEKGFVRLMMHARNPAINFYKGLGYQIEGAEFFEVGIGHHKMQKLL